MACVVATFLRKLLRKTNSKFVYLLLTISAGPQAAVDTRSNESAKEDEEHTDGDDDEDSLEQCPQRTVSAHAGEKSQKGGSDLINKTSVFPCIVC